MPARKFYSKRFIIIVLGCIFSFLLLGLGYAYLWPQYRLWRQQRTLAEAVICEQQGDVRRALLLLEQACQLYPANLDARRQLAAFWQRLGQPQALEHWKDLARLAPSDPRNRLGLAEAAIRFNDLETAREELAHVAQSGQVGADYYRLLAGLALAERDHATLLAALTELARLKPDDSRVQLNLALARLADKDAAVADQGRRSLLELARGDRLRIRAVVELLNDLARRWPRPTRERVEAFQQLAQALTPPLGPRDEPPEVSDPVERLLDFARSQPSPEPEDVGALVSWMTLNQRAAAAFAWVETLPPAVQRSPLVTAPAAEAALHVADWPRLQTLLLAGAWGPVPPEVIEGAFASRANRSRWVAQVESAQASLPALRLLLRLAGAWGWEEEQAQVLVALTRHFPGESWAWRRLIAFALAQNDADRLWQVYQRWSRAAPGNWRVQTEAAIVSLLLQQRTAPAPAVTAELLQRQPSDPGALVAHALALWRAGYAAEGLPALAALPESTWAEPRYALAYGLLLAEAGRAAESERLLQRASAERLLSAEQMLIEQARARNRLRLRAGTPP